jgi:hypothetical protein
MPKILKLLIGFGLLALVFFVWLFTFGIQTWIRGAASDEARKFPGLKLVPVALNNTLESPPTHNTAECSAYLLDLPWTDRQLPDDTKNSRGGCLFSNGQNMIMVHVGGPNDELNHFYVFPALRPINEQKYFGKDPPKTDYQLVKMALAITPDSLKRYGGWGSMERDSKLFDAKKKIVRDTGADDVIFFVATPVFQGFQFSAPESKPSVEVRLYNDQNKVTLQFLTTGKGKPLPQQDINLVMQSVCRDPNAITVSGGKN